MDNFLCPSNLDEDDLPLSCLIEREKSLDEIPLSQYKVKHDVVLNDFSNEENRLDEVKINNSVLFNEEYQNDLSDLTVTILEDDDDIIPPDSIVLKVRDIAGKNLFCAAETKQYFNDNGVPSDIGQRGELTVADTPVTRAEQTESTEITHQSRKRKKNVEQWKQTIRKRRREVGKDYISTSGKVVPRRVSQNSACNCKFSCAKFSTKIREDIFHTYWNLTYEGKKAFLQRYVILMEKKRKTKQTNSSRRKNTLEYFLPMANDVIQVCKTFFLNALAIKEKTVHYYVKLAKGCTDGRGKSTKAKISEQAKQEIKDHIMSYPAVDSHYCRSSSKRKYLPKNLSIRKMYREYCNKCIENNIIPQKFWIYSKTFNEDFNLGFHQPKKDQCSFCETFKSLPIEMQKCKQSEYDIHQKNKQEARDQKNDDKLRAPNSNNDIRILNFDLQKVLLCPKTSIGEIYYSRKYTTYNFTVFDLVSKTADCCMWHEIIGKRGSCEIASCLYNYNKSIGPVKEIISYSDSCTGQQRNLPFSCMCMHSVANLPIEKITHNYFERGHSQMEGDTVHAAIERHSKHMDIFIPAEWMHAVRNSKYKQPKFSVKDISQADIFDFKGLSQKCIMNRKLSSDNISVKWNRIKCFQYRKSQPHIIYFKIVYK